MRGIQRFDIFQPNESVPGGRKLLGKLKRTAGEFSLQVPVVLGALELDAFADQSGDGPSGDDPRGQLRAIDLTQGPVENVELRLENLLEQEAQSPPQGGGTDLEEEFKKVSAGGNAGSPSRDGL